MPTPKRQATTVLHLRKSFTERDADGAGSNPRYRWFPEFVPAGSKGRLTTPPPLVHLTRDRYFDLEECGQVVDGFVELDREAGGPAGGTIRYRVGMPARDANPDEIPLTLVED